MDYQLAEENAAKLVTHIFQLPHRIQYPYHNLFHTRQVVAHVKEIASFYNLNQANTGALTLAAWFHDIGQLDGTMDGHEERSAIIMNNYCATDQLPPAFIQSVKDCILATQHGAVPKTLVEQIICDADTYHFGTSYFQETESLVQQEMEMRTGKTFSEWHKGSLALLQNHVFYTDYCKQLLNEGKLNNLKWLQSLIK